MLDESIVPLDTTTCRRNLLLEAASFKALIIGIVVPKLKYERLSLTLSTLLCPNLAAGN